MFGKHFASMYTGSMYGSGADVFAVWGYVIAHVRHGEIELNPQFLAPILGMPVESVISVLEFLQSPDANSRGKEYNGSRLVKQGQFMYLVPQAEYYRSIKSPEEKREADRKRQAKHRNKISVTQDNAECHAPSRHPDADAESEKIKIAPPTGDAEKVSTEKPPRPRDLLWEAVITACGLDGGTPTDRERSAWNGAVKSLRSAKATPGEVTARAACYRARWPHVSLTPTALARRWTECVAMVDER